MKTKKQIPYIWLSPIITLGIMLVLYAVSGIYPFGTASTAFSDGIAQYVPFLSELSEKIREGGSLLYSWHIGNGINFWTNIGYYLASPLNLIALFFTPDEMDKAFALLTLVKPSIMALTFGIFLKHTYKKNDLSLVVFSILWAMSGFMIGAIFITSWLDAIIYFPLVIMGLKRLMDGESAWMYSLFLGLTIASNFYIGWMTCIFCVIYFIYCFISDDNVVYEGKITERQQDKENESINIFAVFKDSYLLTSMFRFALSSILAGGISAIITLPMVSALQETGKGTVTNVTLNFVGDGIWGLLASHIFPFANNFTTLTSCECIFSFVGIGTLILSVAYFFTKGISIRKKIGNIFLLTIIWLSIIFHDIYFIWHGFGEPAGLMYRFAFIYSFVILKIAYEAFCEIEKIKWYGIVMGSAFAGLCVAGIYLNDVFNYLFFSTELIITLVIFILIFAGILLLMSKQINKKNLLTVILTACVVVEAVVLNFNNINTLDMSENLSEYKQVSELIENIDESETVHFESKKQEYNDMLMYGSIFGYRGLECYSSISDYHYALTITDFGTYGNRLNMQNGGSEQTPIFNMFFPTSYYIDGTGRLSENFFRVKLTEKDGYTLYKNNYTMPFMYTTSYDIADWDPYEFPIVMDNLNEATKCLTGTDENIVFYNNPQNFIYENCTHISYVDRVNANHSETHEGEHNHEDAENSANAYYEYLEKRMNGYSYAITDMSKPASVTFDSVAEADGMMYLYVDTGEFTDLTVTLNGKTTQYTLYGVNDYRTYELGEVKKGDVATITIGGYHGEKNEEDNVYYLENGYFTTISYTIDKEKLENAYNTLDAMSDTELLEFEDTYVKAKLTSYTDGVLYIPTAYDEGWTILIDGVETELYEHESHILMAPITEGEHIVEMKYCPKGFVSGAIITATSAVILIVWVIVATKRRKNEAFIDETFDKASEE